jgi:hypothetical protein
MNLVKEKEEEQRLTKRDIAERNSVLEKGDYHKYPYKNSCKKAVGEYYATLEDKVNFMKYLADHPTMPNADKTIIKDALQ